MTLIIYIYQGGEADLLVMVEESRRFKVLRCVYEITKKQLSQWINLNNYSCHYGFDSTDVAFPTKTTQMF